MSATLPTKGDLAPSCRVCPRNSSQILLRNSTKAPTSSVSSRAPLGALEISVEWIPYGSVVLCSVHATTPRSSFPLPGEVEPVSGPLRRLNLLLLRPRPPHAFSLRSSRTPSPDPAPTLHRSDMSYQVNADELYDTDSGSDDNLASAIHPPSPKRARPSSFSALSASAYAPAPRASNFPSFNASSSYRPPAPNQSKASFPSFSASRAAAPRRSDSQPNQRSFSALGGRSNNTFAGYGGRGSAPPQREPRNFAPRHDASKSYGSALGPMGRGRGATLPAHVTASRANHVTPGRPAPAITPGLADDEAIKVAAAILPEHVRERYIEAERKKAAAANNVERKRPGRRRKENRSAQGPLGELRKRPAQSSTTNGMRSKPAFNLGSLLKAASKQDTSLIRLDPSRLRGAAKTKRAEALSVYTAVSRTKESVEREERLRREEEMRRQEEERQEREMYEDLREQEREDRRRLAEMWKKEKTVASKMRDSHYIARLEKHLFTGDDKVKADNLEYLGLRLRAVREDEEVSRLLTIEVTEI